MSLKFGPRINYLVQNKIAKFQGDCKAGGSQALKPVKNPKIWGVTGNIKSDFLKLILGVY